MLHDTQMLICIIRINKQRPSKPEQRGSHLQSRTLTRLASFLLLLLLICSNVCVFATELCTFPTRIRICCTKEARVGRGIATSLFPDSLHYPFFSYQSSTIATFLVYVFPPMRLGWARDFDCFTIVWQFLSPMLLPRCNVRSKHPRLANNFRHSYKFLFSKVPMILSSIDFLVFHHFSKRSIRVLHLFRIIKKLINFQIV